MSKIDWDAVKKDYDGGLTDAEMAEKYGVKQNTIKVHRNRSGWGKANRAKRIRKKRNVTKKRNGNVTKKSNVTDTDTVTDTINSVVVSSEGLNERQRLFCLYYYQLGNAVRAYVKAYDCSYDSACAAAYPLLENLRIKNYIDELKHRFAAKQVKTTQDMLDSLVNQATANIGDYLDFRTIEVQRLDEAGNPMSDEDGNPIIDHQSSIWLKDKSKMDLSLVSELHKGKDGIVVKLHDKQKAIFKLLEMLPDPIDSSPKENTFLNALQMSKKVFSESEQSEENADNNDDSDNNAD